MKLVTCKIHGLGLDKVQANVRPTPDAARRIAASDMYAKAGAVDTTNEVENFLRDFRNRIEPLLLGENIDPPFARTYCESLERQIGRLYYNIDLHQKFPSKVVGKIDLAKLESMRLAWMLHLGTWNPLLEGFATRHGFATEGEEDDEPEVLRHGMTNIFLL